MHDEPTQTRSTLSLRSGSGQAPDPDSHALGVFVSSGFRELSSALVVTDGRGLASRPLIEASAVMSIPDETAALYQELATGRSTPPGAAATLAARVADLAATAIERLSADAPAARHAHLVGVHDPGLWRLSGRHRAYQTLCDADRLAEATGLNVVGAFPGRDLACGGLGGPLMAIPQWLLLRHADRTRVLLDLGRTIQLTYLPPSSGDAASRILSFDVGPGMSLLDRLTTELTGGNEAFDPGGRLAVQGRRIDELVEHWLQDPYFKRLPPRWHPLGCRHERELAQTVQMAVEAGWNVRDLLCTGCHFIAETCARAIRQRLLQTPPIDELLLTGGGQHNGMVLRELAARLPELKMIRVADLSIKDEAVEAACAALLARLHVEQVPANHITVTGAETSRVLGQLAPGAPRNWQKLIQEMASNRPAVMSLRSAV